MSKTQLRGSYNLIGASAKYLINDVPIGEDVATLNNVIFINEEADFPIQDATTITLSDDLVYLFGDSITTSKQFICGDATIRGLGIPTTPLLNYTGTDPLFVVNGSRFTVIEFTWSCPSADSFLITGTSTSNANERVNIIDSICVSTQNIASLVSGSSLLLEDVQFQNVQGLSPVSVGAGDGSIISFRQVGIFGTVASSRIFDFDNSASYLVGEWQDVFCAGDATTAMFDAATGSANVATGGLFTVNGCNTSQYTTPLIGVNPSDDGWVFSANDGIPDSVISGHTYLQVTETVDISADNDWVKVAGGNWLENKALRVSLSADGDITNTGSRDITILAQGSLTIDISGALGGDGVGVRIVKNTDDSSTEAQASQGTVDSFNENDVYVAGSFTLAPNDSISIWVANLSTTNDIPVVRGKLVIFGKV